VCTNPQQAYLPLPNGSTDSLRPKHPQTAQLLNKSFTDYLNKKKNHKAVAMVITLAQGLTLTILRAKGTWERTQLSRQKISALSRQNYNAQAAC
jgi:hypothetical protein